MLEVTQLQRSKAGMCTGAKAGPPWSLSQTSQADRHAELSEA